MKFEKEFRRVHPEIVGEKDSNFDLLNYAEFLEAKIDSTQQLQVELSALTDEVECLAVIGVEEEECQKDIVRRLRKLEGNK